MATERTYYRIPPIAAGFNHTIVITYPVDTWNVLQLGSGNLRIDFREKVTEPVLMSLYSSGSEPDILRNNTDKSLTINIPGGDAGTGQFTDMPQVMFDIAQELNGQYYPIPADTTGRWIPASPARRRIVPLSSRRSAYRTQSHPPMVLGLSHDPTLHHRVSDRG